jgi:hypothetical protein
MVSSFNIMLKKINYNYDLILIDINYLEKKDLRIFNLQKFKIRLIFFSLFFCVNKFFTLNLDLAFLANSNNFSICSLGTSSSFHEIINKIGIVIVGILSIEGQKFLSKRDLKI